VKRRWCAASWAIRTSSRRRTTPCTGLPDVSSSAHLVIYFAYVIAVSVCVAASVEFAQTLCVVVVNARRDAAARLKINKKTAATTIERASSRPRFCPDQATTSALPIFSSILRSQFFLLWDGAGRFS
jgi:hypothetical protein